MPANISVQISATVSIEIDESMHGYFLYLWVDGTCAGSAQLSPDQAETAAALAEDITSDKDTYMEAYFGGNYAS